MPRFSHSIVKAAASATATIFAARSFADFDRNVFMVDLVETMLRTIVRTMFAWKAVLGGMAASQRRRPATAGLYPPKASFSGRAYILFPPMAPVNRVRHIHSFACRARIQRAKLGIQRLQSLRGRLAGAAV